MVAILSRARGSLHDWAVAAGAVDPESISAPQALGYPSGGGGGRDRRDIDPKDMIETYETLVPGLPDSIIAGTVARLPHAPATPRLPRRPSPCQDTPHSLTRPTAS